MDLEEGVRRARYEHRREAVQMIMGGPAGRLALAILAILHTSLARQAFEVGQALKDSDATDGVPLLLSLTGAIALGPRRVSGDCALIQAEGMPRITASELGRQATSAPVRSTSSVP